ncbi:MAG: O-methyltransferase [Actinomycetes bacterium]
MDLDPMTGAPEAAEPPVPPALVAARRLVAAEDEALLAARARATPADRVPPPEVGALLAWAATTCAARHVVEVGSAAGVTGLWLLTGMEERGVLTSVEPDPHLHGLATRSYDSAGVAERVRSIHGEPAEVLERLSDGTYELVLLQGDPAAYPAHLEHAVRLLKPGGMLLARGVLPTDPADDPEGGLATFVAYLAEREDLAVTVLDVDGGLALATVV